MDTRFAVLLLSLLLPVSWAPIASGREAAWPNIVFIFADDLGYGDVGQKQIQTPHIDGLAKQGMRFTQFHAGSTVCAPSRSVLMTERHMGHTRVRGNARGTRRQMLYTEDVTIAEVLRDAGYDTGLVGKWGLGLGDDEGVPRRQGFDYFFGFLSQYRAHQHFPEYVWRNDEKVMLPNEVIPVGKYGGGIPKKGRVCRRPFCKGGVRVHRAQPGSSFFFCISHRRCRTPTTKPITSTATAQRCPTLAQALARTGERLRRDGERAGWRRGRHSGQARGARHRSWRGGARNRDRRRRSGFLLQAVEQRSTRYVENLRIQIRR